MPLFQRHRPFMSPTWLPIATLLLYLPLSVPAEGDESPALELQAIELKTLDQAMSSQRRVNQLDTEARRMADEYRQLQIESTRLAKREMALKQSLQGQSETLALLRQGLQRVPEDSLVDDYLQRLVTALEDFIRADLPFRLEERLARAQGLSLLLERPGVGPAERLRQILQAYQRELEYGRTIDAYEGELIEGQGANATKRWVTLLRYGRLALVYQTIDGNESGWWDATSGGWQRVDARLGREIRRGIQIARKQMPPDLLMLPLRK